MLLRAIMFFLAALFVFYDILVQVSPGVLTKQIMAELDIGAAGLGVLSGVYFWTYCFMQVPAGLVFDRFRVRTVLFIAIVVTAISVGLFANTHSFGWSAFGRLLMGAGSAFAFIGAARVAADVFSARAFPVLVGVIYVLAALGALFAQTLLVWLNMALGWRQSLDGLAYFGLVLAVLCWLVIRYKPKQQIAKHDPSISMMSSVRAVLKRPQALWIAVLSLCTWGPITMFASLWGVPFLMRAYNFEKPVAAGLVAATWLGLALVSPLLGWLSNLLANRKLPMIVCSAVGLVVSLLLVFVIHFAVWQLAVLMFLLGAACASQPLTYTLAKESHDRDNAAVGIAFNNMAALFSGVLLQPLSGWLIGLNWSQRVVHGAPVYTIANYQTGLVIMPIVFAISLLVALFLVRDTFKR